MPDPVYGGKTKTVAVCDLGGKMMDRKNMKNNGIDVRKDFGITAAGVSIGQEKTERLPFKINTVMRRVL